MYECIAQCAAVLATLQLQALVHKVHDLLAAGSTYTGTGFRAMAGPHSRSMQEAHKSTGLEYGMLEARRAAKVASDKERAAVKATQRAAKQKAQRQAKRAAELHLTDSETEDLAAEGFEPAPPELIAAPPALQGQQQAAGAPAAGEQQLPSALTGLLSQQIGLEAAQGAAAGAADIAAAEALTQLGGASTSAAAGADVLSLLTHEQLLQYALATRNSTLQSVPTAFAPSMQTAWQAPASTFQAPRLAAQPDDDNNGDPAYHPDQVCCRCSGACYHNVAGC